MSKTEYPRLTERVNQSLLEGIVRSLSFIMSSLISRRRRVDLDDFWMDRLRKRICRQRLKWKEFTMKSMCGCEYGQLQ